MLEPLPRPAYLDAADPKQGLITYHKEMVASLQETLREQMRFETTVYGISPYEWLDRLDTLKWEDGSIKAVWRDRLHFHQQALEFLTNG